MTPDHLSSTSPHSPIPLGAPYWRDLLGRSVGHGVGPAVRDEHAGPCPSTSRCWNARDSCARAAKRNGACRIEAAPLKNVSDGGRISRDLEQRLDPLGLPARLKKREEVWPQKESLVEGSSTGRLSSRESTIAPREVVWDAWSDPQQVVALVGAEIYDHIHEMDVRPGGVWRHTMHGPDGTDYPKSKCFYRGRETRANRLFPRRRKERSPGAHLKRPGRSSASRPRQAHLRRVFPSAAGARPGVRHTTPLKAAIKP